MRSTDLASEIMPTSSSRSPVQSRPIGHTHSGSESAQAGADRKGVSDAGVGRDKGLDEDWEVDGGNQGGV